MKISWNFVKNKHFGNYILKTGIGIFLLIASVVFVLMSTFNVFVTRNASEIPIVSLHPVYEIYAFIVAAMLLVCLQSVFNNIKSQYLFSLVIVWVALIAIFLAANVSTYLRPADPGTCIKAARSFNNGHYGFLRNGGYLCKYPYQLYWISWLRFLLSINNSVRFLYYVNAIISVMTIVLIYMTSCEMTHNNMIRNTTAILSGLFLPIVFNTLFIYANVLALLLTLIGIWLLVRGLVRSRDTFIYWSPLPIVAASLFKNNYMIALIAFFIAILFTKLKRLKIFIMLLISIFCMSLCNTAINHYYSNVSHTTVNVKNGMPKSGFVVMGIQNTSQKPGWFSGFTDYNYKKYHHSAKKVDEVSKNYLAQRVPFLQSHKKYAINFFKAKIVTTWGDPTFQSVWNGPLVSWHDAPVSRVKSKNDLINKIYDADGSSKILKLVRVTSQFATWMILIFSILGAIFLLKSKNILVDRNIGVLFAFIFFVGGFLFHLIWETKAQYVYQYVFMLIPSAAIAINQLFTKLHKKDFLRTGNHE